MNTSRPSTIAEEFDRVFEREMTRAEKDIATWKKVRENEQKRLITSKILIPALPGEKTLTKYARFVSALKSFASTVNLHLRSARVRIGGMRFRSARAHVNGRMLKMDSTHSMTITYQVRTNGKGTKELAAYAIVPIADHFSLGFVQATVEAIQKEIVKKVADEVMDDVLKMVDMDAIVGALSIKVAEEVARKIQTIPPIPTPPFPGYPDIDELKRLAKERARQTDYIKQMLGY